jgi:hypothetical protein
LGNEQVLRRNAIKMVKFFTVQNQSQAQGKGEIQTFRSTQNIPINHQRTIDAKEKERKLLFYCYCCNL